MDPTKAMPDEAVPAAAPIPKVPKPQEELYKRHSLGVRVMHWINVVAFFVLLGSGLQIFNAHPALNWGKSSYNGQPPVLVLGARHLADGRVQGVTTVFGYSFDTTGVLGASRDSTGQTHGRGFPSWATVPGPQWLSMARLWHFFFAWILVLNGLFYIVHSALSRHLSGDLIPTRQDWASIGKSIADHVRFRHPHGEEAKRYNILQKLAYLSVIFVLFPLVILMGLGMSPWVDTVIPGWVELFGGRQSARTLHFVVAFLLVGFVAIHLFEVVITGLWNNVRSMITGRYRVPAGKEIHEGE